jgi:hypothetical protein
MTISGLGSLSSVSHIGFAGDIHGDMRQMFRATQEMHDHGISQLVVLGDFGFIWGGRNWDNDVDKLSRRLRAAGQSLHFVDGNHEDFTRLLKFPVTNDGLRWIRPNIAHIPRGYRSALSSGLTLAALGGANSLDIDYRVPGQSIWHQEAITESDLGELGREPADILIGHDAPLNVPALDAVLASAKDGWSAASLDYAARGREMFHRGFMQVKPKLYLGGHYHQHVDQIVSYSSGEPEFRTRVVILDRMGDHTSVSLAVLDVETLELEYLQHAEQTET